MNDDELRVSPLEAAGNDSLLIPKHDPQYVGVLYERYRTVLARGLAANLEGFVGSGLYDVARLRDKKFGSEIYVLTPTTPDFSVPGSGIRGRDPGPTHACNRLVAVSASRIGWHLFAEQSDVIEAGVADGRFEPFDSA